VLFKKPAQLAFSHADTSPKGLDSSVLSIKKAFGDQRQRSRDGIRGAAPTGQFRRDLGPAAKARTKAGLLRGSGGREESAVLPLGRTRRTDRTAVDPGGRDPDEQATIKTRIARLQRSVTDIRGKLFHASTMPYPKAKFSPFSDTTMTVKQILHWILTCTSDISR